MYHFIRRCFVLVLVLAFGCSFLLCCFVNTARSQMYEVLLDQGFNQYLQLHEPYAPSAWATQAMNSFTSSMQALPGINQIQQGGWSQSQIPLYSQSFGIMTPDGSAVSLMDRLGMQLGPGIQGYFPNRVSQSFVPGAETGAYAYPTAQEFNISYPLSSTLNSFMMYHGGYASIGITSLYLPYGLPKFDEAYYERYGMGMGALSSAYYTYW